MLLAAVFSVNSCGEGNDSNSTEGTGLNGEWKTECISLGSYYQTRQMTFFSNDRYEYISANFADAECTTSPIAIISSTGLYKAAKVGSLYDLDLTIDVIDLLPKSSEVATSYSSLGYCGSSNWNLDQSQSVIGASCTANGQTIVFTDNSTDYQQVLDFSEESGVLYLGVSFLLANSSRPTEVDGNVFLKQN